MQIEIVTIGNELLEGDTLNTNAAFLSRLLTKKGYEVGRHTVLPDEPKALMQGLKEALSRSTLVVATGGLGPTVDDQTKKIAAQLFRAPLQMDSDLYDSLREHFGERPALQEQSRVPKDAIVLSNHIGTAPGFLFLSAEGSLLLLPGQPQEMEEMAEKEAIRLLAEHFPSFAKMQTLRLNLCLLQETQLDPILREIQSAHPDAKVGIYPHLGSLEVRFAVDRDFERLEVWAQMIRQAFPTYLFDAPQIHEAVHRALIAQHRTLALAESCTGGALSARLVSMPGASKYLLGALVVYSDQFKESFLHVKRETLNVYGAVSRETVQEMVQSLLQHTLADFAIAISGIAGPLGGSQEKPVGTAFVGVGERSGAIDIGRIAAPNDRASAIEFFIETALGALWRRLAYQTLTFA